MSLIVAARFDTFDQASVATQNLFKEGFTEDDVHTFYINTAGEHSRYPLGGDRLADPDAKGGHIGAVAGASALGLLFALSFLHLVPAFPFLRVSKFFLCGARTVVL